MQKAAGDARKAIAETGKEARQSFADTVEGAKKALLIEVNRLVGGDDPELAARLGPLLERFGRDLDTRGTTQTRELLTTAASSGAAELVQREAGEVGARCVVLRQLLGDGRQRGDGARHPDPGTRLLHRHLGERTRQDLRRERLGGADVLLRRRIGPQVPLGDPDAANVDRARHLHVCTDAVPLPQHHLGGTTADVHHDERPAGRVEVTATRASSPTISVSSHF